MTKPLKHLGIPLRFYNNKSHEPMAPVEGAKGKARSATRSRFIISLSKHEPAPSLLTKTSQPRATLPPSPSPSARSSSSLTPGSIGGAVMMTSATAAVGESRGQGLSADAAKPGNGPAREAGSALATNFYRLGDELGRRPRPNSGESTRVKWRIRRKAMPGAPWPSAPSSTGPGPSPRQNN